MLIKNGWAEKVVSEFMRLYPDSPLYTLIYDEKQCGKYFPKSKIHPSCFKLRSHKIYTLTWKQRLCLPFMKQSVEQLDFSTFDYVIVSSSGFAHRLKTWANIKTLIYYHAPARYLWDWTHEFRKGISMDTWIRWFLYKKYIGSLRITDYESAQNNTVILANSATTQKRISKYFKLDSDIVYPPIETKRFSKNLRNFKWKKNYFKPNSYYIILSALTEFKKIEIAIKNFINLPKNNLLIIGEWDYKWELETLCKNSKNIKFSWAQYDNDLVDLVQNSLGLIFPGEEDFGIVPIEVMAAWKPVFALWIWGLTESVIAWKTWDFFYDPNGWDFIKNFLVFHNKNISQKYPETSCKSQAQKYDSKIFREKIQSYIR